MVCFTIYNNLNTKSECFDATNTLILVEISFRIAAVTTYRTLVPDEFQISSDLEQANIVEYMSEQY